MLRSILTSIAAIWAVLFCTDTTAKKYTVIQSGFFSNAATWSGGNVPMPVLQQDDTIFIPDGFILKLDTPLVATATNNNVNVLGTLTDTTRQPYLAPLVTYPLTINADVLTGNGTIDLHHTIAQQGTNLNFSGTASFLLLESNGLSQNSGGTVVIKDYGRLILHENDYVITDGHLDIGAGGRVELVKGSFSIPQVNNASYDFTKIIWIEYNGAPPSGPRTLGLEASQPSAKRSYALSTPVVLQDDLVVGNGLKGDTLVLNGHKLTMDVSSSISSSIIIKGDSLAEIDIRCDDKQNSWMNISPLVRKFSMNMDTAGLFIKLNDDLVVLDTLELNTGIIDIGLNRLSLLDTDAVIVGGSAKSYVRVQANINILNIYYTGRLHVPLKNNQPVTYPIGTDKQYAPLVFTAYANGTPGKLYAGVHDDVVGHGISGKLISQYEPLVNTSWRYSFEVGTNNMDSLRVEPMWQTDVEVNGFTRDSAYIGVTYARLPNNVTPDWYRNPKYTPVLNPNGLYSTYMMANIDSVTRPGQQNYLCVFDHRTFLAIEKLEQQTDIKVYPNPATTQLHIATGTHKQVVAGIYNTLGQMVLAQALDHNSNMIDISRLAPGSYYLHLSAHGLDTTTPFIKQ